MALIPQERPKQLKLILVIVALGSLYLFHAYWYTPRIVEIDGLRTRLEDLQVKNRGAQVTAARAGSNLEERLAIYERHMNRLEELIPGQEEVSGLLNSMSMEARRMGVEISSLNPGPVQMESYYTRQAFNVEVWGEYHNVGRFLTSVASLPRIVTSRDLILEPFPNGEGRSGMVAPVVAKFTIETYVLPSAPGDLSDMVDGENPGMDRQSTADARGGA